MAVSDGDLGELARTTRLSLSAWRSPDEFDGIMRNVRSQVTPYVLFKSPAWGFWRDAWALGRFAPLIGADQLQLTAPSEQYPDGRVRLGSEILDVEVTEAMMPGRKRADEYAPDAPRMQHDTAEACDRRRDELPKALDEAIGKKARKLYGQKPTLLVYLNIDADDGYREAETRTIIKRIKEQYAASFRGLHVLWGNELL